MIRFGAPLEKVLYSIREWFEDDYPRWYVEPTLFRGEDPRLHEWKEELGVGRSLQDPRRQAAHRQGQPTGVCAQLPIHAWLGGHQLILMATEHVEAPNRAQVWRPYQWRVGPVEVGPFELVERQRPGPTRFQWRLRPEVQASIETNWLSPALESGDERRLRRLQSFVTNGLPKVDGIQRRLAQMFEVGLAAGASKKSDRAAHVGAVRSMSWHIRPSTSCTESQDIECQDLAGFARLRREAEESGIPQDGLLTEKALREILAGMSRGVR